jgi:hypothetical protein
MGVRQLAHGVDAFPVHSSPGALMPGLFFWGALVGGLTHPRETPPDRPSIGGALGVAISSPITLFKLRHTLYFPRRPM